jgi:hypothetical protein
VIGIGWCLAERIQRAGLHGAQALRAIAAYTHYLERRARIALELGPRCSKAWANSPATIRNSLQLLKLLP